MQDDFARWTITLVAQIRVLQNSLASRDGEHLKRAVEVYEAELQELYRYAHDHHIDLITYYHPFAEIEQLLLQLHNHLQNTQIVALEQ